MVFSHADLHGGNFFYQENKQIALIDFGLVGSLGKKRSKEFYCYNLFYFLILIMKILYMNF